MLSNECSPSEIFLVSAWVKVYQTFRVAKDSPGPLTGSQYIFPLPKNSSVCRFEMQTTSNYIVSTTVKRKVGEGSSKKYQSNSRSQGEIDCVALLAVPNPRFLTCVYHYLDFVVSLGNIPPCDEIVVTLAVRYLSCAPSFEANFSIASMSWT